MKVSENPILKKENYFPHQWDFLTKGGNPDARVSALVGGFGCGKTKIGLSKCLLSLVNLQNPTLGKSNGLILYPTYSLAEEVFVEPFSELLEKSSIPYEYNISQHKFRTLFGNIKIYVTNQAHKIVGSNYTFCYIDEIDVESKKNAEIAVHKALGRLRGCEDAELFMTTTPEGFKFANEFLVTKGSPSKYLVHGRTEDNPYLPKSYIASLKENYDENLLKAYLEGKFVNLQKGTTYNGFSRERNIKECKYNRALPIHCGIDFNVSPMACCIIQEQSHSPHIQVIDEILLSQDGSGDLLTERMMNTIKQRYPNSSYNAYPDATGAARHSSSRFSDIQIIQKANFMVHVRHINPLVINRVNSMNNNLSKKNIVIDPKCEMLIRDLEQVVNKEGTRDIDKASNSDLSHISDALGYYIDYKWPTIKPMIGVQDR